MKKKSPFNKLSLSNWLFNWLSIRSKLQTVILLSSLVIILLTGTVGYLTAKSALQSSIYNTLTSVRARQVDSLVETFDRISTEINIYSESNTVRMAFKQLKPAYEELQKSTLSQSQQEQLKNFYADQILPKLERISAGNPLIESYLPESNAGKYLQYYYLANNPYSIGEKNKLNSANDGSKYSEIHAMIQPIFNRFAESFGYYDLFLIDPVSGEVIYTTAKEIDLGTNLKTGIYASTSLGKVYEEVLKSRDPNFVMAMDYENYLPSFDKPASFIGTTIYSDHDFIGVLVFQVPVERINKIMTLNSQWRRFGLNSTGQSLLVGTDYTFAY